MKIEMHCHTICSSDGFITKEELQRQCLKKGVNCICITDHNTMQGVADFSGLKGIHIVAGEEIMTQQGEIIGLFLVQQISPFLSLKQTVQQIKKQGGLVYLPHPFDEFRNSAVKRKDAEKIKTSIDLMEIFNSRTINSKYNEFARKFASDNGIPAVVGSDAHHIFELANSYLEMEDFNGPTDFLHKIKDARLFVKKCPFYLRLYLKALKIFLGKK
jgi:predicted metal-dependent phosphoesterase TrpH